MTAALHAESGAVIPLDVDRWRSEPDDIEHALLATLADPVLDVGCGPGRITAALATAGRVVLGVDPSSHAVAETRQRGAPALQRSVFDPLPGEGRWATALLLDGNIGIGGDPPALLRRIVDLLHLDGRAVVEVEPPGAPTGTLTVRLQPAGQPAGPPFPWARVGADEVSGLAAAVGMALTAFDIGGGRWFAHLAKR